MKTTIGTQRKLKIISIKQYQEMQRNAKQFNNEKIKAQIEALSELNASINVLFCIGPDHRSATRKQAKKENC